MKKNFIKINGVKIGGALLGKKFVMAVSLFFNIALLYAVYNLGCIQSHYFELKLQEYGFQAVDPTKRADYRAIVGWTNTLEKLNIKVDVVFFGNSITRFSDFQKFFPHVKICNLGYGGDKVQDMIVRVEQIKVINPEKVFLMGGINDILSCSDEQFENNFYNLVDSIRHAVPNAVLYLQSILPVNPKMAQGKVFKEHTNKIVRWNNIICKKANSMGGGIFCGFV